jgi:predicted TIM-barrel fold metal-dependent hydrolase
MIIDLDSHLREQYFLDEIYRLDGPYAQFTPTRVGNGKYQQSNFNHSIDPRPRKAMAVFDHRYMSDPDKNWRGGEYSERQRGGWDLERRLKDKTLEKIDRQILFPTNITIPTSNVGGLGVALCRAYNNWVANFTKDYRDHFWPAAMAPAGCPDEMANELRRCVKELGFKAAHLISYLGARTLDDPVFYPYYEAAQELNVPLFCHPNTYGDLTEKFNSFFAMHILGRPLNCTAALVGLVCGGIFEKFPKLRVAFFECSAEWVVYWMHRMDDDYEVIKDHGMCPQLNMLPSEYVKRNCYISCEADEKWLPLALAEVGETHVVMATDYPHFDSTFPNTVKGIRERPDISPKQRKLILEDNALNLIHV